MVEALRPPRHGAPNGTPGGDTARWRFPSPTSLHMASRRPRSTGLVRRRPSILVRPRGANDHDDANQTGMTLVRWAARQRIQAEPNERCKLRKGRLNLPQRGRYYQFATRRVNLFFQKFSRFCTALGAGIIGCGLFFGALLEKDRFSPASVNILRGVD